MGGLAISLGFVALGLALSARNDFNKRASLIAAALFAVVFVTYVIAIVDPSQLDAMISTARIFYLAWVIWPIILGLGVLKSGPGTRHLYVVNTPCIGHSVGIR